MNEITCPNCGPRELEEFRYGGEVRTRPPDAPGDEAEWTDYLYTRQNSRGPLREWWYHRMGCGLWFIALRHTGTHAVEWTRCWPPERDA